MIKNAVEGGGGNEPLGWCPYEKITWGPEENWGKPDGDLDHSRPKTDL